MINLSDASVVQALPAAMASRADVKAVCAAADWILQQLHTAAQSIGLSVRINDAPTEVLDQLAAEWRTPNYEIAQTTERKRALLLATLPYWISAGTKQSTLDIAASIFTDAEILEWFEYGGDPGYFKVSTKDPSVNAQNVADFMAAIGNIKRLSAWLEAVTLALNADPQNIYYGVVLHDTTIHTLSVEGAA